MSMGLNMKSCFLVILFLTISGLHKGIKAKCIFPAIFAFGDSNTDTGASDAIFHNIHWPNGLTVGREFKRTCDGRLIVDFLVESIGFPHLNASVDTNGTSFKYGANFAVVGQLINPEQVSNYTLYPLDVQVSQFFEFKSRVLAGKEPESTNTYPKPEAFSEGLFIIDIGQNDVYVNYGLNNVSTIMGYFSNSVERLLKGGAKYLWVHNTCPFGCLPRAESNCGSDVRICTRDKYGCIMEYNNRSQLFNLHLQQTIKELRMKYPSSLITLVDMYAAKDYLFTNNIDGFDKELKLKYCCGTKDEFCGFGRKYTCNNPSKYLNWDGIHFTEAANRAVAALIADGSFSEPRVAFSEACHKPY